MKSLKAIAVAIVTMMVLTAVPFSDISAETPEDVEYGFVFTSEPDQKDFDEYLYHCDWVSWDLLYALGLESLLFDFESTLSDISFEMEVYYNNYHFDTDEAGVEKYFEHLFMFDLDINVTATIPEECDGYDLFMPSVVGDVDDVKGIIGDKVSTGDKIVANARVHYVEYNEINETDMLRNDGLYLTDSWDGRYAYVMEYVGSAIFDIGGKTTEVSFDTYDSQQNEAICNWRYLTDISDVKQGDDFEYDRNDRILYNSHFCDYTIDGKQYTTSDTEPTNYSAMGRLADVDEYDFYTVEQLNDEEMIYDEFFGYPSTEISKVGDLKKDALAALFKVNSDRVNYIEEIPLSFYDQGDIDELNAIIDELQDKADRADKDRMIIFVLAIATVILIVLLIVALARKKTV